MVTANFGDEKVLNDAELVVWNIIKKCHGKSEAVNVGTIAQTTGLSERVVRKTVKSLIENHNKPIVSSISGNTGYFIPIKPEEKQHYANILKSQIASIAKRLRAVEANTANAILGELKVEQLSIF